MDVQNLTKRIHQKIILDDISFSLPKGEIVGLVGRNGTGKTTLLRTLAGQYLADEGEVWIQGTNIFVSPMFKEEIFYIDEKANFFASYTLGQLATFYRSVYPQFDEIYYQQLMKRYELTKVMRFKAISKGMQGLFKMILAIASRATYLLLDEPFDGLDVIIRKEVIGLLVGYIEESGHTALIASHDLDELDHLVDRVFFLNGATLSLGYELEQTKAQARKLQLVFKTKKVPTLLTEQTTILSVQGRVIVVLVERYTEEFAQKIKVLEPLLVEELPLNLEDLFMANVHSMQKGDVK